MITDLHLPMQSVFSMKTQNRYFNLTPKDTKPNSEPDFIGVGPVGLDCFRIKQVYLNGYVRYSNIRQLLLENSETTKFSVYPNPSKGIVGIKFDNSLGGYFAALIYNTQGQMMVKKDIVVTAGPSYIEIAEVVAGGYWLKLKDQKSLGPSVNQLLIK